MIEGRLRVGDHLRPRRSRTGRIWRVSSTSSRLDGTVWLWLSPVGDEGLWRWLWPHGGVRRLRRLPSELTAWERVP
jgi:hypothetical protein